MDEDFDTYEPYDNDLDTLGDNEAHEDRVAEDASLDVCEHDVPMSAECEACGPLFCIRCRVVDCGRDHEDLS